MKNKIKILIAAFSLGLAFYFYEAKPILAYSSRSEQNKEILNLDLKQIMENILKPAGINGLPVLSEPNQGDQSKTEASDHKDMPVRDVVMDFIKASINLMSLVLYIFIDMLKWLSGYLNSYKASSN